jgi:hypothetical protein
MLPAAGIVSRTIAGETVLVPVAVQVANYDRIFLLNPVGAFLWQSLDGQRDRDGLVALVRERFAVSSDHDVGADVDRFLSALSERGLVQEQRQ